MMSMTARCGAAALCRGATTVRVAAHEISGGKVMTVWIAQSVCSCSRMPPIVSSNLDIVA